MKDSSKAKIKRNAEIGSLLEAPLTPQSKLKNFVTKVFPISTVTRNPVIFKILSVSKASYLVR